jgi:thiosulfate/3-mercaptopyruvate sulfurtransferase
MAGPLVSTEWLEAHLDDPSLVLLEVSFYAPDTAAWFEEHVPGSHYVPWKSFCWEVPERRFASPATMAERLAAYGATDDSTVVLIGDTIQFATYAYWVATMVGLEERVAVLDGGHRAWVAQGRPTTMDAPTVPVPGRVTPGIEDRSSEVDRSDVLDHLRSDDRALIDLRSADEFTGARVAPPTAPFDHGAEASGHIPGARHLLHDDLLAEDGSFLPPDRLEAAFVARGATADKEVVTYCRLSHRASLGWFALTRLSDRARVRVYNGSWTEWGSMVGMPVEQ